MYSPNFHNCSASCLARKGCDGSCTGQGEDAIGGVNLPPTTGTQYTAVAAPAREISPFPTGAVPRLQHNRGNVVLDTLDAMLGVKDTARKDTNPKDSIGDTKVPLWLLSPIAKAHWAAAQFSGLVKYGAWNWRAAGVRASVYLSAMGRHMDAYLDGEEHDPVDGTKHLANIMACCAILIDAQAANKFTDDRPPKQKLMRHAYTDVERLMVKLRTQYADKTPTHYTERTHPA